MAQLKSNKPMPLAGGKSRVINLQTEIMGRLSLSAVGSLKTPAVRKTGSGRLAQNRCSILVLSPVQGPQFIEYHSHVLDLSIGLTADFVNLPTLDKLSKPGLSFKTARGHQIQCTVETDLNTHLVQHDILTWTSRGQSLLKRFIVQWGKFSKSHVSFYIAYT